MLTVGLEPTRANTEHLKCSPLDQLGHVSIAILGTGSLTLGTKPTSSDVLHPLYKRGRESNPHPGLNRLILIAVSSYINAPYGG